MIKDPLHHEETPYDLLNLDPNALHSEVLKALPNFMRIPENRVKIPKAQEAVRKLMNSKDRAAIDILYYWTGKIDIEFKKDDDLKIDIDNFKAISALTEEEYYSDLKRSEFSEYFTDIAFNKIIVDDFKQHGKNDHHLEIFFDK